MSERPSSSGAGGDAVTGKRWYRSRSLALGCGGTAAVFGWFLFSFIWHDVHLMPHVAGQVERDTQPLAGATVSWYRAREPHLDDPSWELLSRVVTDSTGEFEMEARRHRRFWIPLPSDPGVGWRLEVESPGLATATWKEQTLGLGTPSWVVVSCEVGETSVCYLVDAADKLLVQKQRWREHD